MRELMTATAEHFTLVRDDRAEYSIEVDPREASADTIARCCANSASID